MKRFYAASLAVILTAACAPDDQAVVQPVAVSDGTPVRYPVAMWDQRVEGETVLLVHVSNSGRVDSTVIQTSSGYGAFDSAAVEGARGLRFTPGRRGDRYVSMWTRVPIRFALDSTASLGTPAAPDSTP